VHNAKFSGKAEPPKVAQRFKAARTICEANTPLQNVRFESLYRKHVSALKRQGKADSTIDVYSRAVRRISEFFDCPPDILTLEQFEAYVEALVQTHSWSTVKIDRNGPQFFYKYVLKKEWNWVDIVRPPQVKTLPDILTLNGSRRGLAFDPTRDGTRVPEDQCGVHAIIEDHRARYRQADQRADEQTPRGVG